MRQESSGVGRIPSADEDAPAIRLVERSFLSGHLVERQRHLLAEPESPAATPF